MRKLAFCFTLLALAILAPLAIQAQTKGSLSGTVTDAAGAIVPGANVTLKNNATGSTKTATTADNGVFNFTAVDPGTYTLTIESTGFKKSVANDIVVNVSTPASVTIALEAGQVTETVTVTGAQEVINTTSPSLTNIIDTRQVTDLPISARNPLDLAALQAGIAVVGNDTRGASVAGLRQTATYTTQDGINNMDNFVKTSSFFALNSPSLNSVSEFSITTGTVGPEAGRGAAQVNLVTKSGSNDFHGGVFYLHRNDALEANTWFNNRSGVPRTLERQHYFGFDIGGPVYFPAFGDGGPKIFNGKDTAFFFFSYEGFREHFAVTRNRTVMTQAARSGSFSYVGTNGQLQTVNLLSVGNVPTINPLTIAVINQEPLPNNFDVGDTFNTAGYRFNVTGSDPSDKYAARYDHQLVKHSSYGSHKFEFVLNRAHFFLGPDTFNGLEAPFPGGVNGFQESKRWLVTGALVSTFGSSMTNVFRYGKQWAPVGFLRESQPDTPFTVFASISDFNNTFMSQGRNTTVDQYSDNFSWNLGKHLFRFGGDYQKIFADTFNDAGINQTINFGATTNNPSGILLGELPFGTSAILTRANAVYADLIGLLSSSTQTLNVTSPTSGFVPGATRARVFRQQDLALFGSDQWRMFHNLTVNLGVRWEFEGVPTVPNGLAIQLTDANQIFGISGPGNLFNPNGPHGGVPAAVGTLDFVSGDTGIPLYKDDWNNFAPFVGLAWQPEFKHGILRAIFGSENKSSIRMGYSISYLHDGFTTISNALGVGTTNPGLIQSRANNTPTGVLTGAGVTLPNVTFNIPTTDRANIVTNSSNGLWTVDPNIRIPYVQQWNFGFEREILPKTALEIRYVGNHAVKVWRAYDINEVNIFENGFLNEFLAAQGNLAIARTNLCGTSGHPACSFGNTGLPGQVSLPIMSAYFGSPNSSFFSNSTFIGNLDGNNVGTMASTLAFNTAFRNIREAANFPYAQNFFVANPNAAFARILTNDSMSNYNALEIELRKQFSQGLRFQADYTFSKSMTDAPGALGNNQSDLTSFRTLRDKRLDYTRSSQDQTHRFVANAVYELPFGRGRHWFSDTNSIVNHVIGGWTIGGIVTWSTRPPWYIVSNRTTFNNFNSGSAPAQLTGISFDEFKKHVGLFKTANGVFIFDPSFNAQQYLSAPAPGQWGNFPINSINGPSYFNIDSSITKRWSVTENVKLELKTTFINVLNHPNFAFGTVSFDSATFGKVTGTSGGARVIHFTGSVRF